MKASLMIFSLLSVLFLGYSGSIYLNQETIEMSDEEISKAEIGKLIWQKYNCQSCHQIYGLGGYLGPDITNLYSQKNKNEILIQAIISSGNASMPAYKLNANDMGALIAFFKLIDRSGISDPRTFNRRADGMIDQR